MFHNIERKRKMNLSGLLNVRLMIRCKSNERTFSDYVDIVIDSVQNETMSETKLINMYFVFLPININAKILRLRPGGFFHIQN